MKDCAFQYATGNGKIFEDTGLITRAEAEELWQKYLPLFKSHVEQEARPEMAIWIDMKDECDFHTTSAHLNGEDMGMRDGHLYELKLIL